ncbi:MAG: MoaD/ThiS family protein [Blastocatellia bacterium]
MSDHATITVLLFGACREAANTEQFSLETAPDANGQFSVATAFAAIKSRYPQLARFERSALFAVNEQHARQQDQLKSGDTLAIFPPVSGG